jgi:hypothetical protein
MLAEPNDADDGVVGLCAEPDETSNLEVATGEIRPFDDDDDDDDGGVAEKVEVEEGGRLRSARSDFLQKCL